MDRNLEPVKYLIELAEGMKKDLVDLKARVDLRTYTLKEIADGLGCSVSTIRHKPWRMPNYGKSDVGQHPSRWFYNTIENWYAVPEDERRFKWESMSALEKRNFLKISERKKVG